MAFEETEEDLIKNVASLGYDLKELSDRKKLVVDYVHIERSEIEETGEYDLEGLFVRLGYAIDSIGAKRVVLDTIESIFAGLPNPSILRAELRRLFRWLKDKGVTAIVTGERGDRTLTRQGLEEYVSDCVILLDHRTREQISTRRLQIIKYRGSTHGTNEYPFLIDEHGISVLPITSIALEHQASSERISSGIKRLDTYARRQGILSRHQCSSLRNGGNRQIESGSSLRRCRLSPGGAMRLFRHGRESGSDRAKHAQHRHRSRAWDKEGIAPLRCDASHISRIGNASLEDAQAGQGDQCQSRGS